MKSPRQRNQVPLPFPFIMMVCLAELCSPDRVLASFFCFLLTRAPFCLSLTPLDGRFGVFLMHGRDGMERMVIATLVKE